MKLFCLILLLSFCPHLAVYAQVKGCTDPQASNFNSLAKENDGSCIYTKTNAAPSITCSKLNDSILESSGLIYFANWFWTHNDSDNPPYIYAFDSSTGKILHSTYISNKTNTDWEDMTQDSLFIYIGDFGNNGGNRKDLAVLKIRKSDLRLHQPLDTVSASEIRFSFADQLSFNNSNQAHDFDMEAFCVLGDSLHLFSKNWVDKRTRHYVLATNPGTYILSPKESFLVDGQITGACADEKKSLIVLTGYNKADISCFIWLLWDYKNERVNSGNKRRIDIGSIISLGQNEGICLKGGQLYISSEKYLTAASLRKVDIQSYITGKPKSGVRSPQPAAKFTAYQSRNLLIVTADKASIGKTLHLYTSDGKPVKSFILDKAENSFDIDGVMDGVYILKVDETSVKIYIKE